jgi:hypothetical protein
MSADYVQWHHLLHRIRPRGLSPEATLPLLTSYRYAKFFAESMSTECDSISWSIWDHVTHVSMQRVEYRYGS